MMCLAPHSTYIIILILVFRVYVREQKCITNDSGLIYYIPVNVVLYDTLSFSLPGTLARTTGIF